MRIRLSTLLLLAACLLLSSSSIADENWTSFQNGGSNSSKSQKAPTDLSSKSLNWKFEIAGYGQSSPVVFGDRIFLTSVSGGEKENLHVFAVDRSTGKQLWTKQFKNSTPEKSSTYISRAAPSPVCDENGVITFFEGGNLIALSNDGNIRWQLDLVKEYGEIKARHGLASSITHDANRVYVWIERQTDPYLLSINKADGKTVWKSKGVGSTTWSSLRFAEVEGKQHLVASASGKIAGYDPETGKQLWTFDDLANNTTPTPMPLGNNRLLVGASTGRGTTTKPVPSNGVVEIVKKDDTFSVKWLWRSKGSTCSFGSPVAFDGRAYFVNRVGAVFCHDLETGKEIFTSRSPSGSIWATPIEAGENIFLFGKDGRVAVIKKSNQFDLVTKTELWKPTPRAAGGNGAPAAGKVLYAAALVDGQLLIRNGSELFSFQESKN